MKKTLFFLLMSFAIASCYTPKQDESNVRLTKRFRSPKSSPKTVDSMSTIRVTNIPLSGRSENGVKRELAGTWHLHTLNGIVLADSGQLKLEELNQLKAVRTQSDTVSSLRIEGGKTVAVTEVTTTRPLEATKAITPLQGTKYHIPERPYLSFYGSNETFTGFTGCNKISGRYTTNMQMAINFRNAAPSTRMVCIGDYDEATFIEALQSVNNFKNDGEQLELLQGQKVVMIFRRN